MPTTTIQPNTSTVTDAMSITITYPKDDAYWHIGDTVTITWTTVNIPKDTEVTVMLWDADMKNPYPIGKITNTGIYKWIVTGSIAGAHLRLSVHMAGIFTMNPSYVEISP